METLVPGRLPRSALWTAALLLWLGTGALGDIERKNLNKIIKHITNYEVKEQYAFAVSLPTSVCRDPSDLAQVLNIKELTNMRNTINQPGGLYNPGTGHFVAARVNRLSGGEGQHTEWRLLNGSQNSPVQQLLAQTPKEKRCLIFFTLNSPCLRFCLNKTNRFNILSMVRDTFSLADNNYKAFVFQQIYEKDLGKGKDLLKAWSGLQNTVPLMHCNNNDCWNYAGDGTPNRCNPSLHGRPIVRRRLHPPGRGN